MTDFALPYTTAAPPTGIDGRPQQRVVRGRIVLPDTRTPAPVVVVAHGYTSFMDWGFFPALSGMLAAAGIATLRFNFSGSGIGADLATMTEPEVFRRNSYLHELDDLDLVRRHLDAGTWPELDPERSGILGHSRGGAMSVIHAAEHGGYRAVVTWAAMDRILQFSAERLEQWERDGSIDVMHWTARRRLPLDADTLRAARTHAGRLDVLAACRRLAAPLLAVMGSEDHNLDGSAGANLAAAAPAGTLLQIEGGDHTFGARHPLRDPRPAALDVALAATRRHFIRWLATG